MCCIQELSPDKCKKLVGVGTDGAAANIAASGLKGLVEGQLGWVFWMWCMAHRLELAIKDALKGTTFDEIDEMLLRLYNLYEKFPKKCRELDDIVADLKDAMCFGDASGSRWVVHKLNAMKRVISKYGAYTNHLLALSEDPSVRSADKANPTLFYFILYIYNRLRFCLYFHCVGYIKLVLFKRVDTHVHTQALGRRTGKKNTWYVAN